MSQTQLHAEAREFQESMKRILTEVGKVIVGQGRVVECTVTAILCGGHVLLEGVPGLGKTELVKTLARVMELDFKRIQFTPDLMPADILGTSVMNTDGVGGYQLEFRPGPIFTQMLLADEINRATPKTQSAMLECMQEGTVTTAGNTHPLKQPFFVLATQNPIEHEGTYELPEAQVDRFMLKVHVPFLDRDGLNEVVNRTMLREPTSVEKVVDGEGVLALRSALGKVVVADPVRDYAVRLVLATHPDHSSPPPTVQKFVRWGASPRAAQALVATGRARALADGRAHVAFEDVRHFAREVLQHRVILNYDGEAENIDPAVLIAELLDHVGEEE